MTELLPFFSAEIDSRLEETRVIVANALKACGELPDVFQVDLALTEAVNNAVEHAYAMKPGCKVRVELYRENGGIRFDVIDWGSALDPAILDALPDEMPEPDPLDIDSLQVSGRGLMIIKNTMDAVWYQSDSGRNRFSFFKKVS